MLRAPIAPGVPTQLGRVVAVLAPSQQDRFAAFPSENPHVPTHSLEPPHRWSPGHHIRNDHRCVPSHLVGMVPAPRDSEAKAPLRVLQGQAEKGQAEQLHRHVPSHGRPGPCSPCSASPCAAPRSPSPPCWAPASASAGQWLRQPARVAAPAQRPGARTGCGSSVQLLAPSSAPLQAATKSRSKAEPQAPGTTRVQGTDPPSVPGHPPGTPGLTAMSYPADPAWEQPPKP